MVKKISIIGSGNVGSTLAFHILSRLNVEELVLLDIAGNLAKGVALDLEDTRFFLGFSTKIVGTSNWQKIRNSDIVVVTCGKARKEGQTRYDLLKENGKIAKEVSLKIKKLSAGAIVVVVTNPVDFITYVVKKETGFERERVIGLGGILDTARFVNILYKNLKVNPLSINTTVIGLHSKDMIPLVSHTKIGGLLPLDRFLDINKIQVLKEKVKERGKDIVQFLKNRSAHFAPSLACYRLVEAIAKDNREVLPVSIVLKGEYGFRDTCLGLPCIIGRRGVLEILKIDLSAQEKGELSKSVTLFKECMKLL